MRLNPNPEALREGDFVTTDYEHGWEFVERRILHIITTRSNTASGVAIVADGGEQCVECGRPYGRQIGPIDGGWFIPAGESDERE